MENIYKNINETDIKMSFKLTIYDNVNYKYLIIIRLSNKENQNVDFQLMVLIVINL